MVMPISKTKMNLLRLLLKCLCIADVFSEFTAVGEWSAATNSPLCHRFAMLTGCVVM